MPNRQGVARIRGQAATSGSNYGHEARYMIYSPGLLGQPPREQDDRLPLMDPTVLVDLAEKLDSPDIANKFARDYAAVWPLRQRRLAAALNRRDHTGALDVAISLKVSSAMVGGVRLARLAEQLEHFVRRGDLISGLALMDAVTQYGRETVKELQLRHIPKNE